MMADLVTKSLDFFGLFDLDADILWLAITVNSKGIFAAIRCSPV